MTLDEKNQKYSNLCVLIGDTFIKAKHYDTTFRNLVKEAEKLLEEQPSEEKNEKASTSVAD